MTNLSGLKSIPFGLIPQYGACIAFRLNTWCVELSQKLNLYNFVITLFKNFILVMCVCVFFFFWTKLYWIILFHYILYPYKLSR
jgi:hypothetical protein